MKNPYYAEWRGEDGSRNREAFSTAGTRDGRVAELKRQMQGREIEPVLTREQVREYQAFKQATGSTPWVDVVAGWRSSSLGPASTLTVADAVKEYLADARKQVEAGQLAAVTETQKVRKMGLFKASFGGSLLHEVTPPEIEEWIDDLGFESSVTFNDYRKHVSGLFSYFSGTVPVNPALQIEARSTVVDSVGVLTPDQTATLFAYALKHHPDSLGRLALEAFAGLRFSSSYRLEKSEINFEDKGILLPKHKIKTRRRFYIDQLPDNLWLWLAKTNDACWALSGTDWMHLKSSLFANSKVPHPHNCLRHSFCTYHVAAYKDPGRTATILCHANQQKLWSTYYGIGSSAAGKAYFAIVP